MKRYILIGVFCTPAISGWAITSDTTNSAYPTAACVIGYGAGPALGRMAGSFIVETDVRLTAHWGAGLLAFMGGQKLDSNYGYLIDQPGFSVVSLGLSGMYRTSFRKKIIISASLLAGITNATLQDRSERRYVYTGRSTVRQYKSVDDAVFFLAQPTVSIAYRINNVIAIAINSRYDLNWGKTHWVSPSDFSGPRGDISIVITPSKI